MNEPLDSMELGREVYQTVIGHLRLNPRWDDIHPEVREAWEAGALKVASIILDRYLELSQAITNAGCAVIKEATEE